MTSLVGWAILVSVIVRSVGEQELQQLKQLRLRALLDAPGAFGSSYADEVGRDDERWRPWVTGGCTFVIADDQDWYGLAAVFRDQDDDLLCHLVSMWIAPACRRRGLGRDLLVAGIDWARRRGARKLCLGVVVGNSPALGLYRLAGFEPTGDREPLRSDPSKTVMYLALDLSEHAG
jgi:ribosomal protein S18 acetylase RimI-like enzyme